jgi:5-methylcytosine-specific restriction endonuclease McrA
MRAALRRALVAALHTDAEAVFRGDAWSTRCLHCRSGLRFDATGAPLNDGTLEHVVPRTWFGKRAAQELAEGLDGPDDPKNLALACPRCNQQKGKGPDAKGPSDARAREIVAALQRSRMARWRDAGEESP